MPQLPVERATACVRRQCLVLCGLMRPLACLTAGCRYLDKMIDANGRLHNCVICDHEFFESEPSRHGVVVYELPSGDRPDSFQDYNYEVGACNPIGPLCNCAGAQLSPAQVRDSLPEPGLADVASRPLN